MFSRTWSWVHDLPCLLLDACFPKLGPGCMICRAYYWMHVFPSLVPGAYLPTLVTGCIHFGIFFYWLHLLHRVLISVLRVPKGFSAPGHRAKKCRVPGLQDRKIGALGLYGCTLSGIIIFVWAPSTVGLWSLGSSAKITRRP